EGCVPHRESAPAGGLGAGGGGAVGSHGDWRSLAFEESLAGTVRGRRTGERLGEIDRVVRDRFAEVGERGEPRRLTRGNQVIPVESADGGDPGAARNALGAGGEGLLDVAN